MLKYLKSRNVKHQFNNQVILVQRYLGFQRFSKPFNSMNSSSWYGKEIWGMIWTLAVNCALILDSSKNDVKTEAETTSDEMVMGEVQAWCEFSLLVSQQNHSDQSLTALDDALKRFYKNKGAFREQKMLKSAKDTVDELWARNCHQLRAQKIHKIRTAIQVQVYGAVKVTTTTRM